MKSPDGLLSDQVMPNQFICETKRPVFFEVITIFSKKISLFSLRKIRISCEKNSSHPPVGTVHSLPRLLVLPSPSLWRVVANWRGVQSSGDPDFDWFSAVGKELLLALGGLFHDPVLLHRIFSLLRPINSKSFLLGRILRSTQFVACWSSSNSLFSNKFGGFN
jgi:hypothetical protein